MRPVNERRARAVGGKVPDEAALLVQLVQLGGRADRLGAVHRARQVPPRAALDAPDGLQRVEARGGAPPPPRVRLQSARRRQLAPREQPLHPPHESRLYPQRRRLDRAERRAVDAQRDAAEEAPEVRGGVVARLDRRRPPLVDDVREPVVRAEAGEPRGAVRPDALDDGAVVPREELDAEAEGGDALVDGQREPFRRGGGGGARAADEGGGGEGLAAHALPLWVGGEGAGEVEALEACGGEGGGRGRCGWCEGASATSHRVRDSGETAPAEGKGRRRG
eukprot:CAMPEP_0182831116 /NCGR_PEP_ID=MMETSP0006_2-20121128/18945_1 /TAXON_ID=97485 /ORGANISM="Prymnesium parvum, Strain Texoma1" /LENGTH=277 /DNA_ID=CAMNT_0024958745 /DNA_START=460 /DNA_END=1290 /DNA_ORIENTATION=-